MKRDQKGFTLIELMIVVSIIGLLAAIALPAYDNYTRRTRAAEAVSQSTVFKTTISSYYQSVGAMPANNAEAGLNAANTYTGPSHKSIDITAAGEYTITFTSLVEDDATLIFTAAPNDDGIIWSCKTGTLLQQYRSPTCR